MPNTKIWSSNYPTELDTSESMPSVQHADYVDISHVNELKKAILELETLVGSDDLESGSLRYLINNVSSSSGSSSVHTIEHILNGSDEINGDQLDIDFTPTYYVPISASTGGNVDHLAAHLKGIDDAIGSISSPSSSINNNKLTIIYDRYRFSTLINKYLDASGDINDKVLFLPKHSASIAVSEGEYFSVNLSGQGNSADQNGSYMIYGFTINSILSLTSAKYMEATSYTEYAGGGDITDLIHLNFNYIVGPCPEGIITIYPFASKKSNTGTYGKANWYLKDTKLVITQLGFNSSNTYLKTYLFFPS